MVTTGAMPVSPSSRGAWHAGPGAVRLLPGARTLSRRD